MRVLCPVRRTVTVLDCVLLKDRNLALAPREGHEILPYPLRKRFQSLHRILNETLCFPRKNGEFKELQIDGDDLAEAERRTNKIKARIYKKTGGPQTMVWRKIGMEKFGMEKNWYGEIWFGEKLVWRKLVWRKIGMEKNWYGEKLVWRKLVWRKFVWRKLVCRKIGMEKN
jgi:hypothetical protein